MMGFVFTEVLPWIAAALIAGFVVGWLFWRGRYGRYQAQIEEKLARARSLAGSQEARVKDLSGQLDRHRSEVARLSAQVETLEDKNSELSAAALQANAFRARIGELQLENEALSKRASRAEGGGDRTIESERRHASRADDPVPE